MGYGPNLYPDPVAVSETRTLHSSGRLSRFYSRASSMIPRLTDHHQALCARACVTEHAGREESVGRGGYSVGAQVRWAQMSAQLSEGLEVVQEEGRSRWDPRPFKS